MSSGGFQSKASVKEGTYCSLGVARKVVLALMLVVIFGSFAAVGWARLKDNWRSTKADQGQYLSLGLEIREGTALTDGNRHPLYPALLALFAEQEWVYFTKAKMLSLAIGLVGLGTIYWMGHRILGQDVALLTILLLSVGDDFRRESSMAMCEALLTVLFFAAWYFTIKGFSRERYWILGGTFAGLAQLTKGSGQLFAIAFLISLLLIYGPRVLVRKSLWAFVGCYLAVTSVLMAYNYREHGNPLYNFNTTHAMWLDEWEDSYVASLEELPTLTSYWHSHSPGAIVTREWEGFKAAWLVFILSVIPAQSWYMRDFLRSSPGLMILLVGAVGLGYLFRERLSLYWRENRARIVLSLVLFILFYVSIAWYAPVTPEPRLMLPLSPIFYVFVAEGLCGLGRRIGARLAEVDGRLVWAAYVASYIGLALWVLSISVEATQSPPIDPFELDRLRNAGQDKVLAWLSEEAQSGGTVLYGPSHSLPTWKYSDRLTFLPIPSRMTWEELIAYMEDHAVRYVLLDGEMVSRRQSLFRGYFQALGEERVDIQALPDRWDLIFANNEEIPCEYCIFRVNGLGPAERWRVDVGCPFGQEVRLVGYSLETNQMEPGQVGMTLYWQQLRSPPNSYDVLLKLISLSYKVWGQQSGSLPGPFLPLEWWKQGQIVKDRRVVEPLSATPPGSYYIEVHVYNPSAERWLEPEGECDLLLGPVQVSRREPPAIEGLDMDHPVGAVLGGRVRLLGYNIESGFRPGDNIHLTLFWQCLEEMDQDYTVFTHLIDEKQNIRGQKDNPPVDGFYPTSSWEAGEIVRDQYDILISPETPPGEHQIEVGMYLAETGERLGVVDRNKASRENRVLLQGLQISP